MTETNIPNPLHRNQEIDLLRGMSILAVILMHCGFEIGIEFPTHGFFDSLIFNSGYYGVIIFFVISGFLITGLSLRRWGDLKMIKPSQFYRMRFARIMPLLIALLIMLSLLNYNHIPGFILHTLSLPRAIFATLTFHMNWLETQTDNLPYNWAVLWSLSVEEMFYVFSPIACIIFRKNNYITCLLLIFIILGPFARTILSNNHIWQLHSYLSCMDGIAFGCLAGIYVDKFSITTKINKFSQVTGVLLILGILCLSQKSQATLLNQYGLNVTLLELGCALILIHFSHTSYPKTLMRYCFVIRWLGKNSYENYLTHMFFVVIISKFIFNPAQSIAIKMGYVVLVILCSGLSSQFIAYYFSNPLNRLLRQKKHGGIPSKTTV